MKRTLITLGVFAAVLCTLAFAATGQGPISQLKQMLGSASQKQSKSITELKIDEASLALARNRVPDSGKTARMKKLKSSLQTQVVDLWKFDDGTSLAHNGYVDVDLASNVIDITGSDLSFNALLTKQKDGVDSWVASYKNMYNFSGRLEADGDAVVKPCILYLADDGSTLYIQNSTEVTLSAENNYTSDFFVDTWVPDEKKMYLAFSVQKSDKSTVIKSHDNAFYSSREILVAEKWSAEKNLPGLGITEDMADNAYTIVCPDTVTTLGLYLAGDTLCMVGMNTTATSFVAPSSVFINDKEYAVELFGKPKFDTFDWSGSQSVTALDLSGVKDVNLLFGGSSVTDLYLSTYCSINSYGYLGNIYLHLPYGDLRSPYKDFNFKRILIGEEQPEYPESAFDNAWIMPGEREGDYFGVMNNAGYLNLVEIITQEESVVLPATSSWYGNKIYITQFGAQHTATPEALYAKAPNLKSVVLPERCQKLFVDWEAAPFTELHIMGSKPETQYALPSGMSVYIASQEIYNDFKYDDAWNSAELKPEGWELKKLEAMCADSLTTLEFDYFDGELGVVGIRTTATTVTIPDSVVLDSVKHKVEIFGDARLNRFDWSEAQSVTTLNLTNVEQLYFNFEGSAITDLFLSGNFSIKREADLSQIYVHMPYGVNRNNYGHLGAKRVLIGEEKSFYPEPRIQNSWVIAGEREGDYFSIMQNGDRFCVVEIFTEQDSIQLPESTPYENGSVMQIASAGNSSYYETSYRIFEKAPNLKSLAVPAGYNQIYLNWNNSMCRLNELHMKGNMPTTNWNVQSSYIIYIGAKEAYDQYSANSNWNRAELMPEGWDFDWLAVNVQRKGEFAQTYIEMTDADWSQGINVKVIGALNDTDLSNIKKLTRLRCLDLADATFQALPSSFLNGQKTIKEITLPENLKIIPSYAFNGCQRLAKVNAAGVERIENYAFNSCYNLADFDISKVAYIGSYAFNTCSMFAPTVLSDALQTLGSNAFAGTAITEIAVPQTITALENNVFSGCQQLQKVTLSPTLRTIGSSTFENCTALSEMVVPEAVTSIGNNAFSGCSALSSITLPETLTKIGSYAFSGCSALTELTIPSSVEDFSYSTLQNCSGLLTVKCKAIVPPLATGSFTGGMDLNHCTLYIAPFTIDAYRDAQYWSEFYIMKPLNEPVKNIYVKRPMTFDLQSGDNAVLQDNPNMTLDYNIDNDYWGSSSRNSVGQLTASGDGTLSAGVFTINNYFYNRNNNNINENNGIYYSSDRRPTLLNNAENMRADSVLCKVTFEKNEWHFISFQYDVQMSDVYALNNTDYVIRQYNSAKRAAATGDQTEQTGASSNWEDVPADGVLQAGKGYIIQAANNTTNENGNYNDAVVVFPSRNTVTKNRLFTSNDIIVPLEEYAAEFAHNRSWNLVGNPYPCYFSMNQLKDEFYSPIVLWMGNSYQAYSPIDDDIILRPYESFFVQRPIDVEQMVFGAEGRMHYNDALKATQADSQKPGVNSAPARSIDGAQRNVFNFTIEGCGSDNRTRIVLNEKASMDYDCSRDAAKFFASKPSGAEIYVDADVKYDICERPLADGTAQLAIRTAKAGEYTITLSGRYTADWTVMLTDRETGATVNLCEGAYTFEAAAGTTAGRFQISFKSPLTAIDAIAAEIGADAEVTVVNTAGMTVFSGSYAEFKTKAQAGIYVVVCGDKTYKTVIK
mgnify:FL=1